jgi:hypothetical protein
MFKAHNVKIGFNHLFQLFSALLDMAAALLLCFAEFGFVKQTVGKTDNRYQTGMHIVAQHLFHVPSGNLHLDEWGDITKGGDDAWLVSVIDH